MHFLDPLNAEHVLICLQTDCFGGAFSPASPPGLIPTFHMGVRGFNRKTFSCHFSFIFTLISHSDANLISFHTWILFQFVLLVKNIILL